VGLARIQIRRRRTPWTDRLRSYKVRIDGEEVGDLQPGDEKTFEVQPGRHEIQLAVDWGRSQPVQLDLAGGDRAQLLCHGRNPLLALYWITAGRNRYIALDIAGADPSRCCLRGHKR
jgi:hypothetical protein